MEQIEHLAYKFVSPPYVVVKSDKRILQVSTVDALPNLIGKIDTDSSCYEFADQFVFPEDSSNDAAASTLQRIISKVFQRCLC